jgi:hypothetical protein
VGKPVTYNDVWAFSGDTYAWTLQTAAADFSPRFQATLCRVGEAMIVLGGRVCTVVRICFSFFFFFFLVLVFLCICALAV